MNKKEKLAFAVVAALAMTSGGFAFGQSVNNVSSDQVIYACVTGVNGNITKVSNTPKTCPRGTTPISWNMVGPKGDQGIQGLRGDPGLPGLRGERGESGKSGIYFRDSDEIDHPVITFAGLDLVEVDGFYWAFSGLLTWAVDKPARQAITELFTSNNCSGTKYTVSNSKFTVPNNIAFSTPIQNFLLGETGEPTLGYSVVPSEFQDPSAYLSYLKTNYLDGEAVAECILLTDQNRYKDLQNLGVDVNTAYFSKNIFIGSPPNISAENGWTLLIK